MTTLNQVTPITITDLPAATTLTGNEATPIVQGGATVQVPISSYPQGMSAGVVVYGDTGGAPFPNYRTLKAGEGIAFTDAGEQNDLTIAIAGGGSGAPATASYVVMSASSVLDHERVLGVGFSLSLTDTGANGTVTIGTQALTGDVTSSVNSFATTLASGIDAVKIADGSVSNTEFQYLDGATSNIQTQLNAKGGVSTVSVTTANGVSGSVATATTTPAITLTLGAITPTTVVASSTVTGTQLISTVATGTAPLTIASTTQVANLNAASAGSTTNTAITDDTTTNASMNLTWVTSNSGNLPQKVSSTKLTFNPSTGILTATGFSGPLTGNVTGNVSGSSGSSPAASLTGTTLASNVVTSSLTSVGIVSSGTWASTKVGLAYGGTNADLSATGGTSRVLKQTSSGAAITVAQLAASDLSNGTTGSGAVVLASAISGATLGIQGAENRFYNGDLLIDQINEGAAITPSAAGYVSDGWRAGGVIASSITYQVVADAPTALTGAKSLKMLTASSTSPSAAQQNLVSAKLEGLDTYDLAFGTASSQNIMVEFWAKSSLTGNFACAIRNAASDRAYVTTYNIASANTWTKFSLSIPGDTTGTWPTTNTSSINIGFDLGSGSNAQATVNTWSAGNFCTVSGAVQLVATGAATLNITNLRIYAGSVSLTYSPSPYEGVLGKCQRYYEKTFPQGTAVAQSAGVTSALTVKNPIALGDPSELWQFKVTKRTTPTIVSYNPSAGNANWRDITAAADSTVSVDPGSTVGSGSVHIATSGTVTTLGDILAIHVTADARL